MAEMRLALLFTLVDKLSQPLKGLEGKLDGFAKKAEALRERGDRLQATGLLYSENAKQISEFMMGLIEPAAKMADLKSKMMSIDGLSETMVNRASERADAWQAAHAQDDEVYLAGFSQMFQATRDLDKALGGTEAALSLVGATGGDTGLAMQALSQLYDSFADKARPANNEFMRLADTLVATKQRFNIREMDQFQIGIKAAATAADTAHVSFGQVAAVMGGMWGSVREGRGAGMAMTTLLEKLPDAARTLRFRVAYDHQGGMDVLGTLQNFKDRFGDLSALSPQQQDVIDKALGGQKVFNQLFALTKNLDDIRTKYKEIEGASGAAGRAMAKAEESPLAKADIFKNKLDDIKKKLGFALIPMLEAVLPTLNHLVDSIGRFADKHPLITKVALGFGLIGAGAGLVIGKLLTMTGWLLINISLFETMGIKGASAMRKISGASLLTGGKGLGKLAAGGVGAVFSAGGLITIILAATAAVGVVIYKFYDRITGFFQKGLGKTGGKIAFNSLLGIVPVVGPLVAALKNFEDGWRKTKVFITSHSKEISAVINASWASIKWAISWSPLGVLQRTWSGVSGFFRRHGAEVSAVLNWAWSNVKDVLAWTPLGLIAGAWGPVKGFFQDLWGTVVGYFEVAKLALAPILDRLAALFQPVLDAISAVQGALGPMWGKFVKEWSGPQKGPATALMAALAVGPATAAVGPDGTPSPEAFPAPVSGPAEPGGGGSYGVPPGAMVSHNDSYTIIVQAAPGQDIRALAQEVARQIKAGQARASREALHDAF